MPELPWTGVKQTGYGVAGSHDAYATVVRRRALLTDGAKAPDPWWLPVDGVLGEFGDALVQRCLTSVLTGRSMAEIAADQEGAFSLAGKQGAKISSTARRRREATRMSCTRSMSDVSSTPAAWSNSSSSDQERPSAAEKAEHA
mgnify:CR=1 FL=1